MKQSLVEFELDLEKMPLGKLSHAQLRKAYQLLTQLIKYQKEENKNEIKDYTTQFYHLVPHVLKGKDQLPLLDTQEAIETKIKMIDSLLEIEAAVQLLKTEGTEKDENENPIDLNYKNLKTNLSVLDKE